MQPEGMPDLEDGGAEAGNAASAANAIGESLRYLLVRR
jgi:hypothetical protein